MPYFNYTYRRTGTLWEGRLHACLIHAEAYFLDRQRCIELNPVRANKVEDPADCRWSSYQINGLGAYSKLITPHPLYLLLGRSKSERLINYRQLFELQVEAELLKDIRYALITG